ncbi:hypothetical protein THIAE_10430 [Thiomicrospira aerophila AL3]|uniref:Uncharacterized protein n=1 Tax=Thiomicrospira aerophila AL3 TaxID=717772 RepID=W0DUY0_9GAMM|nr:hypothetical protein [Thiomicrospira aerophila]AHF02410.1 hypothetical protein THIAE_10430 [Thiomicrospira aerophila AL3]
MSTSINPAMQSMAPIQMGRMNSEPNASNTANLSRSDDTVEMTAPTTQVNLNTTPASAPVDYLNLQPTQQVSEPVNVENATTEQNNMTSGLTYASALQAESNFFGMQTGAADLSSSTPNGADAS